MKKLIEFLEYTWIGMLLKVVGALFLVCVYVWLCVITNLVFMWASIALVVLIV